MLRSREHQGHPCRVCIGGLRSPPWHYCFCRHQVMDPGRTLAGRLSAFEHAFDELPPVRLLAVLGGLCCKTVQLLLLLVLLLQVLSGQQPVQHHSKHAGQAVQHVSTARASPHGPALHSCTTPLHRPQHRQAAAEPHHRCCCLRMQQPCLCCSSSAPDQCRSSQQQWQQQACTQDGGACQLGRPC